MSIKSLDLSKDEINAFVDNYVLSERDRKIVLRKWIDGITFEKLGEEFNLSTVWVHKIVSRAEKKLRDKYKKS